MFQPGAFEVVRGERKKTSSLFVLAGMAISLCMAAPHAQAQSPRKSEREVLQIVTSILGAPAFALDGALVGEVTDIYFDEGGNPARLRISAASHLGLGTRTIEVPGTAFRLMHRAVVLGLPAEAIAAIPEFAGKAENK
jgi:hypothetical protein